MSENKTLETEIPQELKTVCKEVSADDKFNPEPIPGWNVKPIYPTMKEPEEILDGPDMNYDSLQLLGYVWTLGAQRGTVFPSAHICALHALFLKKHRTLPKHKDDFVVSEITTKIKYINYENKIAWRTIEPISLRHGTTEWHTEPQWFLKAYDFDKKDFREFALADIIQWNKELWETA